MTEPENNCGRVLQNAKIEIEAAIGTVTTSQDKQILIQYLRKTADLMEQLQIESFMRG